MPTETSAPRRNFHYGSYRIVENTLSHNKEWDDGKLMVLEMEPKAFSWTGQVANGHLAAVLSHVKLAGGFGFVSHRTLFISQEPLPEVALE